MAGPPSGRCAGCGAQWQAVCGGFVATSLILSVINLQASDEWDRLPGNISDEGFFVVVFAFFPSYFLLHTVRKILRKIQLKS